MSKAALEIMCASIDPVYPRLGVLLVVLLHVDAPPVGECHLLALQPRLPLQPLNLSVVDLQVRLAEEYRRPLRVGVEEAPLRVTEDDLRCLTRDATGRGGDVNVFPVDE